VPHGCDGSATTKVAIQIPEDILSVTPTRNPLWEVTKQRAKLAKPVTDAHGNAVTERDATVTYTAITPLPDGYRDAFEVSLKLPDEAGKTLVFPAIQTCQKGETPWTEVAAAGQDPEKLEHPAPTLTITATENENASGPAAASQPAPTGTADAAPQSKDQGADSQAANTMGAVGLCAGVLGLLAGATALVQVRRRA
jgi:uncharacterized protein YcnI